MKVINVPISGRIYTCNTYLVLGPWKRIEDVNAMVDVGADPALLASLDDIATGVGKRKVELVVLTHAHSDHYANLPLIKSAWNPTVCAWSRFLPGVDHVLEDGEKLHMGDTIFEVIHTPGHSEDSICLYNEVEGALFVGDTPVIIRAPGGTYEPAFVEALERLCNRDVRVIYPGHGDPITQDARGQMLRSLALVKGQQVSA